MKKVRQRIIKKSLKKIPEIKANNSNQKIRKYILSHTNKIDCDIYAVVVNKSKIKPQLFEVKNRLYNFLCKMLLKEINPITKINITIDKKYNNTLLRENFNYYITNSLKRNNIAQNIEIKHIRSNDSQELQIIDFVVWAIARKYNHNDSQYYNLIVDKIRNK